MNGETPIFTINKSLIYYLSNSYVFMGLKTAQNRRNEVRMKHIRNQNESVNVIFFIDALGK
jgi:hypothetical protein